MSKVLIMILLAAAVGFPARAASVSTSSSTPSASSGALAAAAQMKAITQQEKATMKQLLAQQETVAAQCETRLDASSGTARGQVAADCSSQVKAIHDQMKAAHDAAVAARGAVIAQNTPKQDPALQAITDAQKNDTTDLAAKEQAEIVAIHQKYAAQRQTLQTSYRTKRVDAIKKLKGPNAGANVRVSTGTSTGGR